MGRGTKSSRPLETCGPKLRLDAKQLVKKAQYTRTDAAKICRHICTILRLDPNNPRVLMAGPTKTAERSAEKALIDYGGNIRRVQDACRFMILFDDPRTIPIVRDRIFSKTKNASTFQRYLAKKTDFSIERQKDMFLRPKQWGYMSFYLYCEPLEPLKNKYVSFEIQITHRGLHEEVYPGTHKLYEGVRKKIEQYEKDKIPFGDWDEYTKIDIFSIWSAHYQGAKTYGLVPYIEEWPQLDVSSLAQPAAEDISPVSYEGFNEPGF